MDIGLTLQRIDNSLQFLYNQLTQTRKLQVWNLSLFCLVFVTSPLASLVFVTLSVIYLFFLSRFQREFVTVLFAFCHVFIVYSIVFQLVALLYIIYICLFYKIRKDLSFNSLQKWVLSHYTYLYTLWNLSHYSKPLVFRTSLEFVTFSSLLFSGIFTAGLVWNLSHYFSVFLYKQRI